MEFKELAKTTPNTVHVDWDKVEKAVGFLVHDNIKNFYSRGYGKYVRGSLNFNEEKMLIKTGDLRNDKWFSENECEGKISFEFYLLEEDKDNTVKIENAFNGWTGGNDFGHRALIGTLYMNIGSILILLNNDTGNVEWMDCEYGYFVVYEENPNGILAHSVDELFANFSQCLAE